MIFWSDPLIWPDQAIWSDLVRTGEYKFVSESHSVGILFPPPFYRSEYVYYMKLQMKWLAGVRV